MTSSENIFGNNFGPRICAHYFQHLLVKHKITPNTSSENYLDRFVMLRKHHVTPNTSSETEDR